MCARIIEMVAIWYKFDQQDSFVLVFVVFWVSSLIIHWSETGFCRVLYVVAYTQHSTPTEPLCYFLGEPLESYDSLREQEVWMCARWVAHRVLHSSWVYTFLTLASTYTAAAHTITHTQLVHNTQLYTAAPSLFFSHKHNTCKQWVNQTYKPSLLVEDKRCAGSPALLRAALL